MLVCDIGNYLFNSYFLQGAVMSCSYLYVVLLLESKRCSENFAENNNKYHTCLQILLQT